MKKIIVLFAMLLTVCATTVIVPQAGYALTVQSGNTYYNYGVLENYVWIYGTFINTSDATLNSRPSPGVLNVGKFENQAGGTVNNYTTLANFPEGYYLRNSGIIYSYAGSTMSNGGTLTNYAGGEITHYGGSTLSNYGTLTNAGILTNAGTFDQYYAITQSPARKLVNSGTLTNSGTMKIATKTSMENSGTFTNSGALNISGTWVSQYVQGPVTLSNTGMLTNSGSMNITGTPYSSTNFVQAFLTNTGTMTLTNQGTLTSNDGTLKNYGTLTNHGTLTSTTSNYIGDWGRIYNYLGATIDNYGTLTTNHILDNYGTIRNYGTLKADYKLNNLSGATLTNYAGAALGGSLYNYGTLHNSGRMTLLLYNYGTLYNYDGATQKDGALFNYGTLHNNAGAVLSGVFDVTNGAGATLNNYGTMNHWYSDWYGQSTTNSGALNNYGTLNNSRTLQNAGTLVNNSGATLNNSGLLNNTGMLSLLENSVITGTGTYTQTAGQTVNNGTLSQNVILIDGGSLSGSGIFNGQVTIGSGASVEPGNSPGTMTINGDFLSSGNLFFEIGGLNSGEFDQLSINGNVIFKGGVLTFDFVNGYQAKANDRWDFFSAQTIQGWDTLAFAMSGLDTGLDWSFIDVTGGKQLLISEQGSPVPVPSAIYLLGSGLVGLIGAQRKKKA